MNTNVAANKLVQKFGSFGITKRKAEKLILKGTDCGLTVKQSYNFARYYMSQEFGTIENFTIEDVMDMTGMSRSQVIDKFSDGIDEMSEDELDRYFDANSL